MSKAVKNQLVDFCARVRRKQLTEDSYVIEAIIPTEHFILKVDKDVCVAHFSMSKRVKASGVVDAVKGQLAAAYDGAAEKYYKEHGVRLMENPFTISKTSYSVVKTVPVYEWEMMASEEIFKNDPFYFKEFKSFVKTTKKEVPKAEEEDPFEEDYDLSHELDDIFKSGFFEDDDTDHSSRRADYDDGDEDDDDEGEKFDFTSSLKSGWRKFKSFLSRHRIIRWIVKLILIIIVIRIILAVGGAILGLIF